MRASPGRRLLMWPQRSRTPARMPRRRARDCGALLEFEEVRRRLRLGTRIEVGRREIEIAHIVGSVGRAHEFDGCFRPRTARLRSVVHQIRASSRDGLAAPIRVYQVDQGYFVEDGHKRLAVAIEEGGAFVDADVASYSTRYAIGPGATLDEVHLTAAEARFRELTGLDQAAPHARFPLSDPDSYLELEESVKAHAYDLSVERKQLVSPVEGARHWYEAVFAPSIELARDAGMARLLASCSEADLFLVLRRGINMPFDPGWQIPSAASERGRRNLVSAGPGRVSRALDALGRRRARQPHVLDERRPLNEARRRPRKTAEEDPEPAKGDERPPDSE